MMFECFHDGSALFLAQGDKRVAMAAITPDKRRPGSHSEIASEVLESNIS